jgi:hypothetical protein
MSVSDRFPARASLNLDVLVPLPPSLPSSCLVLSTDFSRLALLRPHLATERLTSEEIAVVTSYLATEIPQVKQFYRHDHTLIRELVAHATVETLTRRSKLPLKPEAEDVLVRQGQLRSTFLLVLNGKLTVLVGKDQFRVDKGPWTVLGADVLTVSEGFYVPDFTAFVSSDQVRVIVLNPFYQTSAQRSEAVNTTETISETGTGTGTGIAGGGIEGREVKEVNQKLSDESCEEEEKKS